MSKKLDVETIIRQMKFHTKEEAEEFVAAVNYIEPKGCFGVVRVEFIPMEKLWVAQQFVRVWKGWV